MSNDSNKVNKDEEYHYPEDEYVGAESSADSSVFGVDHGNEQHQEDEHDNDAQAKKGGAKFGQIAEKVPFLKNKRVVGVIGVAVVVLVAFHFMHANKTKVISNKPATQPTIAQQPAAPMVDSQLAGLKQKQADSQATVSQLQNQVDSLQQSLNESNQSQEQIAKSTRALAAEVKSLSAELATMKKPAKKAGKYVKPIYYHIKAVVPGRAWISGSDGSDQTVTVGNKIPQYGVVQEINAAQGQIMTSSGKVIDYGSNDS